MDCKSKSNTSCMHLCENDTILHDVFTGVMWVRKKNGSRLDSPKKLWG